MDIEGTGEPISEGINLLAFRADMDALKMPENNPTLPYRTTTSYAHMCGHDGHTVMLLGAA